MANQALLVMSETTEGECRPALEEAGFRVAAVRSGEEALARVVREPFELVLGEGAILGPTLQRFRTDFDKATVLLLGSPSGNLALEAEWLEAPFDARRLGRVVQRSREIRRAMAHAHLPGRAVTMPVSIAKNELARVLERTARGPVFITKHDTTRAVLLSVEAFEELTKKREPDPQLETLRADFDSLLEKMQAPAAKAGTRAAFEAPPNELGAAAVAAVKKRD